MHVDGKREVLSVPQQPPPPPPPPLVFGSLDDALSDDEDDDDYPNAFQCPIMHVRTLNLTPDRNHNPNTSSSDCASQPSLPRAARAARDRMALRVSPQRGHSVRGHRHMQVLQPVHTLTA